MKVWRSYGPGHSAHPSIVGEFKSVEDAELIKQAIEDTVNAELEKRYPDIGGFNNAWHEKFVNIILSSLAANQSEYFLGMEYAPDVVRRSQERFC